MIAEKCIAFFRDIDKVVHPIGVQGMLLQFGFIFYQLTFDTRARILRHLSLLHNYGGEDT